jgi:peptidase MA superfamily protein
MAAISTPTHQPNDRHQPMPTIAKPTLALALALLAALCAPATTRAQTADGPRGLNGLTEVAFAQLSDTHVTALGQAALGIRAADWKHGETTNFVYHFFHGFIATPVSVEAEFYYRVIAKELEKDTAQWERKSHIFIFEKSEDWRAFQSKASLDPWTGGVHAGGELFLLRDAAYKFKGRTLGHEIAHLVVHRFFGNGIPISLNEGYAEYSSIRGYAAFERARGYSARPSSHAIAPGDFIPLDTLASMVSYPANEKQVPTFYEESEKLVRFLCKESKQKFLTFLDAMSKGNKLETALWKAYGGRFPTVDALDREFKDYATTDHANE